jgi:hypothetical protein
MASINQGLLVGMERLGAGWLNGGGKNGGWVID